ncbi:GNAT family protein [Niveibacterium umoris]|uniref:GNAT family N-acetyltransferase n=1 Tax=Niveibacterium umoris TaxID=1193620 RepID=UPI0030B83F03
METVDPAPAFPSLTTPRLRLRELTPDDTPEVFEIHSDAEGMRWFGSDLLTRSEQALGLIETFAAWRKMPNPGTRWGIERKENGHLIGTCGLFKWNRAWRSCTIGYELARSAWGVGYMREALVAMLQWGFDNMALNRVEALIHPENQRSRRTVARLGFAFEGRMREAGFWNGETQDLELHALLMRDWPPGRLG